MLYMRLNSKSAGCLWKSAILVLLSSTCQLRLERADRPGWRDACVGLKESEPYRETNEYTSAHASPGVQCLCAHKWAACCHADFASSFFTYSTVECAAAQQGESDYVQRLDRRWEGDINLKENHQSFPQISASSGASQAGMWIKTFRLWDFSVNQTCSSSSLYCDCMSKPLSGARKAQSSTYLCGDSGFTFSVCQPQVLLSFSDGFKFVWWKRYTVNFLYMCFIEFWYNHFTPLIISVTCQICGSKGEHEVKSHTVLLLRLLDGQVKMSGKKPQTRFRFETHDTWKHSVLNSLITSCAIPQPLSIWNSSPFLET